MEVMVSNERFVIEVYSSRLNTASVWADGFGMRFELYRLNAPRSGGYVRFEDGGQVCDGLARRGDTLYWTGTGDLCDLIDEELDEEVLIGDIETLLFEEGLIP